jgi:hypothetical protein
MSHLFQRWGQKFITEGGPAPYAVLVDARHYGLEWREKFYWRLTSTEHCEVLWTALAPIHLKIFLAVFSEDWDEDAFATAAVTKHVKLLETTKAVESFCRFAGVNQEKGLGAAKLLPTGEIAMVVPPLYATHVGSEKAGDRVDFEFSWVRMNVHGEINVAEHAPEPQEGWEHVEARVRDHAVNMNTCRLKVSEDMVKASEAKLLAKYENEDAFALARKQRESNKAHFVLPRPKAKSKAPISLPPPPSAVLPFGEPNSEYNPYEAFKTSGGASGSGNQGKQSTFLLLMLFAEGCCIVFCILHFLGH